jgi:Bleomycin resistance protein-like N-terminal
MKTAAICLNTLPSSYHSQAEEVVRGFTEHRMALLDDGPKAVAWVTSAGLPGSSLYYGGETYERYFSPLCVELYFEDLERAKKFYRVTLGLSISDEEPLFCFLRFLIFRLR